jgi:hypothetical protein
MNGEPDQNESDKQFQPDPEKWDDPVEFMQAAEQYQQQQQQSRSTVKEIALFVFSLVVIGLFVFGTALAFYVGGFEIAVVVGVTILITLQVIEMM